MKRKPSSILHPPPSLKGIPDPAAIPGWFDWLPWATATIARLPEGATYVEIGSFLGKSTCAIARLIRDSGKHILLHAVDPLVMWQGADPAFARSLAVMGLTLAPGESFRPALVANLAACGVSPWVRLVPHTSAFAAPAYPEASVDVVFVDGDHGYAAVREDIHLWWPTLKPGGVMAGHDIHTYQSVADAVRDALAPLGLTARIDGTQNLWEVTKP